jgi:hypothetical protein
MGSEILLTSSRSLTILSRKRLFLINLFNRLFFYYSFIILKSLTVLMLSGTAGRIGDIGLSDIIDLLESLGAYARYLSCSSLLLSA